MKRFISVLMSVCLMLLCAVASPARVWAEEVEEPVIVYRESFQKTGKDNRGSEYVLGYNVVAKSNGELKINFDCVQSGSDTFHKWNEFGEIRINDFMIAPIGEKGYSGTSKRTSNGYSVIESYSEDYTVYTLVKQDFYSSGAHIDTFYFYVREPYLYTEQVINVCGTEIVIPFGDEVPISDQTQQIHELEGQINDLNSEIERLKGELEVAHWNQDRLIEDIDCLYDDIDKLMARRGDINDDGQYTVADVVLLARYVAGTIDSIPYYPPE